MRILFCGESEPRDVEVVSSRFECVCPSCGGRMLVTNGYARCDVARFDQERGKIVWDACPLKGDVVEEVG